MTCFLFPYPRRSIGSLPLLQDAPQTRPRYPEDLRGLGFVAAVHRPFQARECKRPKRFASPAFERPYLYHHPIRPAVIVRLQLSGISVAEAAAASACLDGPAELLCSAPVPLKAAD